MTPVHVDEIDLGRLSDRELLLLSVKQSNQLVGQLEDLDCRVGSLEKWRDRAFGGVALVAFLLSFGAGLLQVVR